MPAAQQFVRCVSFVAAPFCVFVSVRRRRLQAQYVIQERNVTHLEAHSTGVKQEELAPVISFLRSHLGLSHEGDTGPSHVPPERLAEAQFPLQQQE